jgi:hypothetical protein
MFTASFHIAFFTETRVILRVMNTASLTGSFPRKHITLIVNKQVQNHLKDNNAVVQVDRLIFRDFLSTPVLVLVDVFVTGLALGPLLASASSRTCICTWIRIYIYVYAAT